MTPEQKKAVVLAAILLLSAVFQSCNNPETKYAKQNDSYDFGSYSVVEIDSCEYVVFRESYKGGICHKGNCKFCAARHSR